MSFLGKTINFYVRENNFSSYIDSDRVVGDQIEFNYSTSGSGSERGAPYTVNVSAFNIKFDFSKATAGVFTNAGNLHNILKIEDKANNVPKILGVGIVEAETNTAVPVGRLMVTENSVTFNFLNMQHPVFPVVTVRVFFEPIISLRSDSYGGSDTANIVNMLAGDDTAYGFTGNDVLIGGLGRDILFGEADNDILIGDGSVLPNPAAEQIKRLYIATLDRAPDDTGWQDWSSRRDGGQALNDIAAGFVNSREFQAKYGTLDNTGFVTQLYRNVLDREPDAGGLANAVNALNSGALSRTQIVTGFSESAEFRDGTSNTLHLGQVYRLYGATLARTPDAGGFETWTDALGGGRSLVDVAQGFVGSREFQERYGNQSNEGFVNLLYQNVLGRGADAGGLAFWKGQLDSGAQSRTQVVTGFSESQEYINATRPGVDTHMRNVMTAWSDTLIGGAGDDQLAGGRGSDRFVFTASEASTDTIYGFERHDTLELRGFGFSSAAQALGAATQQGSNVVLAYTGGSIIFADTQLSVLQAMSADGWVFG